MPKPDNNRPHHHTCHAVNCKTSIPPEMLMCWRHWYMVPYSIRSRVLVTYRPGQCDDWMPSAAYCDAAKAAVLSVVGIEGVKVDADTPEIKLYDLFKAQAVAVN